MVRKKEKEKGYLKSEGFLLEMEQLKYKVVVADNNKGAVDEGVLVDSSSSSSSSSFVSRTSSGSSLESDSFEEVTSPPSSSSSSGDYQLGADPLSDMSSFIQQLPIKRGLSKYYQGKANSFTSLEKVNSLEDLAKPENPYNKKLKSCRSHGGRMDETHHRAKSGSDNNFMGSRPPIPPHRSTSTNTIPNHTALFV